VPVIQAAAARYGVDPKVLAWQLSTESGWNPNAFNRSSGTMGLGQFKAATAREMGINPWVPEEAIMGAAGYMRKQLDRSGGDYERAISRYGTFSTGHGPEADGRFAGGIATTCKTTRAAASASRTARSRRRRPDIAGCQVDLHATRTRKTLTT
jgi:soluble lytic murein transglycosylase-like protein